MATKEPIRRRELQAQQTRQDIVSAARQLFAEQGYTATSVKDIATAAGVSVQTVYDSVGSKPALVLALNDVLDADAGVGQVAGAAFASGTVDDLAALPARVARAIVEHAGDIVRLMFSTAPLDPAVKAALDEGRARHLAGARAVAQQLDAKKALRTGVTVDEAADTLAALSEVTYVLTLHDDYGWSLDRIEAWTTTALKQLVLR